MNWKQTIIVISAFAVSALIVWRDLPLEFPGTIIKVLILFVKLSLVFGLAIFVYIFAADKKKS
jgi:putative effector of murein hydrolase LrgA (UPF0299 family)